MAWSAWRIFKVVVMFAAAFLVIASTLFAIAGYFELFDFAVGTDSSLAKTWKFATTPLGSVICTGALTIIALSTVLVDRRIEAARTKVWRKRKAILDSRRHYIRQATTGLPIPLAPENLEPNIACFDEDLFVEVDQEGVFREVEEIWKASLRAASAKFCNDPKLLPRKEKVGIAEKVRAQILFYEPDWPERIYFRVDHACWLNEKSPYVSLGLDGVAYLIVGVFTSTKGENGYKDFTIYGNDPVKNIALPLFCTSSNVKFNIKVRLIIGEHGEFSSEHDFELRAQSEGYSFGYVDEKELQKRKRYYLQELVKSITEGEQFFSIPLIDTNWDKFYSDLHKWRDKTSSHIRRFYGLELSSRFDSPIQKRKYPHWTPTGREDFLSQMYSHFLALQTIASGVGALFARTNERRLQQDVALKRLERLIADLSEFSNQGDTLIHNAVHNISTVRGDNEFAMRKWEDRVYTYLENHLGKEEAIKFVSDDKMEKFEMPEGSTIKYHGYMVDRTHTRLVRLRSIRDDVKRGYDAVKA